MRKELGKISSVRFGEGGYQDCQFGLFMSFSFAGSGVQTSIDGGWSRSLKVSEHTKWSEEDRLRQFGECMVKINDLMIKAKVSDIQKLVGIPIEAEFDGNLLKDWRILEEVL